MKTIQRRIAVSAVAAAVLLGMAALISAGPALAAGDTATLTVSASVTGSCKFTSGHQFSMNFGALDPSAAANQSQSASLTYKCTKNTAATSFSFDGASAAPATVNITNGTDNIPVTLTWAVPAIAGSGFGTGSTATSMSVTGAITGTAYENVSAGAYTKNVSVVVAP